MKRKIIFIDTYYPGVFKTFRDNYPEYQRFSYNQYKEKLINIFFGTADFYSYNLRKLGVEADEIIVNDEILQKKWALENGIHFSKSGIISKLQGFPYVYRFLGKPKWIQEISLAQIKKYSPEIVYIQDLSILNKKTLEEIKKYCKLVVGQIASPLPPKAYIKKFNLIISSFPHFVEYFKRNGIHSEYQKLAFEPRILKKIGLKKRIYDTVFIGSFTPYHSEGTKILEKVASQIPIHVWGTGVEYLSPGSPLRKNYHGEAWGLDMYKIFAQSKIVINRHISVSDDYANNMRLYEATGMGALLITDHKSNLNDLFKVGEEIEEYNNSEEMINKINYYLKNSSKREKIAKSGQMRTLRDNTYQVRMKELLKILKKYV